MSRLADLSPAAMSEAQRRIWRTALKGERTAAFGLHNAWLRSPELAARLIDTGLFLREQLSLAPRCRELTILIMVRRSNCAFAWVRHENLARDAGIDDAVLVELAAGQKPHFADGTDELVYEICDQLDRTRALNDALYARAVATLGEQALAELVAVAGYYVMAAMTLNAFDVQPDAPAPF